MTRTPYGTPALYPLAYAPNIAVWHDTRYAAALWGVEQMTLAGAMPHDIAPIAQWYAVYVTGALDATVMLWRDVTGELIITP